MAEHLDARRFPREELRLEIHKQRGAGLCRQDRLHEEEGRKILERAPHGNRRDDKERYEHMQLAFERFEEKQGERLPECIRYLCVLDRDGRADMLEGRPGQRDRQRCIQGLPGREQCDKGHRACRQGLPAQ